MSAIISGLITFALIVLLHAHGFGQYIACIAIGVAASLAVETHRAKRP